MVTTRSVTSPFAKLSYHHCSTGVSLGGFEDEGVPGDGGQRNRP
jgi:hypothetical protein